MTDNEVIALVDKTLAARRISDSTKAELQAFSSQLRAGSLNSADRRYLIGLCKRLLGGPKNPISLLSDTEHRKAREDADARRKRIECRHQTGEIFETAADLEWLYFDLGLRGALEDWQTERDLEDFVREPIWESLWYGNDEIRDLTKQAARYVDRPLYHCTALRDFFILRLMEALLPRVGDDPPTKKNWKVRVLLYIAALLAIPFIWIYINWWTAVLVMAFLWFLGRRWQVTYEGNANNRWSTRHYSKHFTQESIRRFITRVREGGFDEPTLIQQLELFDISKTMAGTAVPLGGDGTPVQAPFLRPTVIPIVIPDVLYTLLRLPRRNVQSEISSKLLALNERKRDELTRRWRKFIDSIVKKETASIGGVRAE
jgi:hypothetical protein